MEIHANSSLLKETCYKHATPNQKAVALETGTVTTAIAPRSKDGQDLFQVLDASRNCR